MGMLAHKQITLSTRTVIVVRPCCRPSALLLFVQYVGGAATGRVGYWAQLTTSYIPSVAVA